MEASREGEKGLPRSLCEDHVFESTPPPAREGAASFMWQTAFPQPPGTGGLQKLQGVFARRRRGRSFRSDIMPAAADITGGENVAHLVTDGPRVGRSTASRPWLRLEFSS